MLGKGVSQLHRRAHFEPKGRTASLPTRWLSIDPGEVHVGLATWRDHELLEALEVTPDDLLAVLENPPDLVVIEDFALLSPRWGAAKARQASATLKLIGGVHALCGLWNCRVVEQQPSVRHVAQRSPYWRALVEAGSLPSNPHARSAAAHGLYYARFSKR